MVSTVDAPVRHRFGRYVLDTAKRQVLRDGFPVPLPWRCFDALTLLVEASGAVVDRELLFRKLWPGIEVEETSLTKVVSQLRRALSKGDPGVEYVETVPRLGYRLLVPAGAEVAGDPPAPAAPQARRRRPWLRPLAAGLALALLAAGIWGWQRLRTTQEADRYFEEGRRLRNEAGPTATRGAIDNYRQAIRTNPGKAAYYAALAETLGRVDGPDPGAAREAAEAGVRLDPNCGGCRAVLGFLLFSRYWEWNAAGEQLFQALKIVPQEPGLHGYLAMYLAARSRLPEALQHAEECVRLDPYFAIGHQIRAQVLILMGRNDQAVQAANRSLAIQSDNPGPLGIRASAHFAAGRHRAAIADWAALLGMGSTASQAGGSGNVESGIRLLLRQTSADRLRSPHALRRAEWKLHLGDREGALDELEIALAARHFNLMYAAASPAFANLQGEPRFQAILRKAGLVP